MATRDLVIVGAGPAGLTAAIYAQRAMLDAMTIEQESIGGQVILTDTVDNYPGVPHANGFDLVESMRSQAVDLGADIRLDTVEAIRRNDDATFAVRTATDNILTKTIVVAGGATPRHAGFDGEQRFGGHGVSYCATCDGMFYRGKDVFVIGGGNSAAEEALFLTRFARRVTLVVRKDHMRAQAAVVQQLEQNSKVSIRYDTSVVRVEGDELPSSIEFRDNVTGQTHVETYDEGSFGIFVFVGRVPATSLISDLVDIDDKGYVRTDERMATRTPGLFAAGDLREKPLRQIVTAASDGAIAATSAASYLGQPIDS